MSNLEKDEQKFLEIIDRKGVRRIDVYRNPELNDDEFLVDYMFGVDSFLSDQRADFGAIIKKYFQGVLDVDHYDNVTLNRDQRRLNMRDKKMNYLLKQRRTVSEKMTVITRLEIAKR